MMTLQINYLLRIALFSEEQTTGQITDTSEKPKKPKK